jgi:outer membrane protein assembly factor BamB
MILLLIGLFGCQATQAVFPSPTSTSASTVPPVIPATASPPTAVAGSSTLAPVSPPLSLQSWPEFDYNSAHSGDNPGDPAIGKGNVSQLRLSVQVTLPGVADGAPAFLAGVNTPSGPRDLLFLTTRDGSILALDAHTGAMIWQQKYPAGSCLINNGYNPCYTTSSPAIDPGGQYVYTYGLDGAVHKLQVGNGTEITNGGWPQVTTLKGYNEKGSSALTIAVARDGTPYLYVTNGGYLGDRGDYQGHLTAINLNTASQRVFNTSCSDQPVHFNLPPAADCPQVQSALWARAGVVYDATLDRIFMATGNGLFDPGQHDWGDTTFSLNPDGSGLNGNPLDSYTPADYNLLQKRDLDLGSTAPAILPVPAGSRIQHLGLQSGKDSLIRLLNLDNLNGHGGPGYINGEVAPTIPVPQGGMVFTTPAVWVNPADGSTWTFIGTGNGLSGLRLTIDPAGDPSLQTMWVDSGQSTSPVIVNGLLYKAGSGQVQALDPTSGTVIWSSSQIGSFHWESPIVINGNLYITDESSQLSIFTLTK